MEETLDAQVETKIPEPRAIFREVERVG